MQRPNEEMDVYYIPPNFLTSGRLFGGMIRVRNAIEACVLVLLTGIPILQLPFSLTTRIVILCLITLPLGVFGVVGIDGDSLSEFVFNWCRWLIRRRMLYRTDVSPTKQPITNLSRQRHQPPDSLDIELVQKPVKHSRRHIPKGDSTKQPHRKSRKEIWTEDLIPVGTSRMESFTSAMVVISRFWRWSRSIFFFAAFVSKSTSLLLLPVG